MHIRDRVKELRRVRASELLPNPKNWRKHPPAQAEALRGLLTEIGNSDVLLARETGDGKLMLIDGHLRAETMPDTMVPVAVLDITEAEGDLLLMTLDPLAAMAKGDAKRVEALLSTVRSDETAPAPGPARAQPLRLGQSDGIRNASGSDARFLLRFLIETVPQPEKCTGPQYTSSFPAGIRRPCQRSATPDSQRRKWYRAKSEPPSLHSCSQPRARIRRPDSRARSPRKILASPAVRIPLAPPASQSEPPYLRVGSGSPTKSQSNRRECLRLDFSTRCQPWRWSAEVTTLGVDLAKNVFQPQPI
jgi:hypothetical protein